MPIQDIYHYPPDLFNLLVDTIPLLCKSKNDVILFFRGAGVPASLTEEYSNKVRVDRNSITKYDITRGVLAKINENSDRYLRERREVLKRVVEFESFSSCYPENAIKARGFQAEVRKVVDTKDSFTRMRQERDLEHEQRIKEQQKKYDEIARRRQDLEAIKSDLYSLFSIANPQERGKKLEKVLNDLFKHYGILVRESFAICDDEGAGICEQIDGVIDIDGQIYLVEMKWLKENVDINQVSRHFARLFLRAEAKGIFISASDYTPAAIRQCEESISQKVMVLCTLQELVRVFESEGDLLAYFKKKINAAIVERKPYYIPC